MVSVCINRAEKRRQTAIFSGRYGVVFGMALVYAALAKWRPSRAVSRVSERWQSCTARPAALKLGGAPANIEARNGRSECPLCAKADLGGHLSSEMLYSRDRGARLSSGLRFS